MNDAIRMQISSFVDGELPDNEADLLLRRMGQDAELRHQVAEYLAIGRALRGETAVPGVDRIHERVAAQIDEKPLAPEIETPGAAPGRAMRPLVGAGIAATVALVAIFGLQQTIEVDDNEPESSTAGVAENASGYTVPSPLDDQLRQYYLSHRAIATDNGANGISSRFVSLQFSEQALSESARIENAESAEDADKLSTQP